MHAPWNAFSRWSWPGPTSPHQVYRRVCAWLESQLPSTRPLATTARKRQRHESLMRFEPLENRVLLATYTVTSIADSGVGTFRDAIDLANANPGDDIIEFNVAGAGVHTITPTSALPTITDPVTIDATSQTGYAGTPLIELSGELAGASLVNGLTLGAASTVKGLAINEFSGHGIQVWSLDTVIEENFIGTDALGISGEGNVKAGIRIGVGVYSPDPLVPSVIVRNNLISGNSQGGIQVGNSSAAVIQGNKIGTDVTGTVAIANQNVGISFDKARDSLIGGTGPGEGNLIVGVYPWAAISFASFFSYNNRVEGNFLGTDVTGTQALGNGSIWMGSDPENITIGGSAPEAGNVIWGSVTLDGSDHLVQGNNIGVDVTGTGLPGFINASGIVVESSGSTISDNVVANFQHGLVIRGDADNNLIENNAIGTDRTGNLDLRHNQHGIFLHAIGSDEPDNNQIISNLIRYNRGEGIRALAGTGNAILSNSIYANSGLVTGSSGLGIDLGGDGVSANDLNDIDTGPNSGQNYPVLTSVIVGGGNTTISGTLNSTIDTDFRIQFFSSETLDGSGFGEGQQLLTTFDVTTNSQGNASLFAIVPTEIPTGHAVSATATRLVDHDSDASTPLEPRDTSEFSQSVVVGSNSLIGSLNMPFDGRLSVGIYNSDGLLVRTLFEAIPRTAGNIDIYWDGRDDFGNEVAGGDFQWRAIVHQAEVIDDGSVGDMGTPPWGADDNNHFTNIVAVDSAGNVYEHTFFEEAHGELRKWDSSGNALWNNGAGGGGKALAVDNNYVYAAFDVSGENRVLRFSSADGSNANWPGLSGGYIVANMTGGHGVLGLAVDNANIWVSNNAENRIEIYDKSTGVLLSQFAANNPEGIALDTLGNVWVVNSGDRVTRFDAAGTPLDEITGFDDPRQVAVGGPNNNLYVGDFGTSTVREFDANTLAEIRELFGPAEPGPISDYLLRWSDVAWSNRNGDLAVDSAGNIIVADFGNQRVVTYAPDGSHVRTRFSEYIPAPMVDPSVDPDMLLSGVWQYDVDYTAGATYGLWELTHNWRPTDGQYFSQTNNIRRTLDGRDYLFSMGAGGGLAVYALEPGGMRRSAILGRDWSFWNWTDTNGNGQVEETEKSYLTGIGDPGDVEALGPGFWVDHQGNFWIADWHHWRDVSSTVKVPLQGFDALGNPMYDWAARETVVDVDLDYFFDANNMRVDPASGDVYLLGTSSLNRNFGLFWMGGSVVDRRAADGSRINLMHIGEVVVAIATDTDGQYFYTGHSGGPQHWVRMYTNDGLMVGEGRIGPNNGSGGGWIDHGMGISAFTHPNGTHYVYAEEVFYGKSIRYRVDGINTLQRFQGNFSFGTAPTFTVTNTNDSGLGSLREAILTANAHPGPDVIDFDIAGAGVRTITPLSALPDVTDPVIIDGTTQAGYAGTPLIEISGLLADPDRNDSVWVDGLKIVGGITTVRGLVINDFTGSGILVSTYGDVSILDNYLGTTADGTQAAGNNRFGLHISGVGRIPETGASVYIGDNLISGNDYSGIQFSVSKGAVIQGNFIGTDFTGTIAIPNSSGIATDGSFNILIGGTGAGEGNLISGNLGDGIQMARPESTNNRIEGNFIGTDAAGSYAIGNGQYGIHIRFLAQGNTIGGDTPEAGNVISGNHTGIYFGDRATNNLVQGNLIGTDSTGTAAIANTNGLFFREASNTNTILDNVISGNSWGVVIWDSSENVVQNNMIGTDATGTLNLGNSGGYGISFRQTNGPTPDRNQILSNVIAHSGLAGIGVADGSGNAFVSNSIFGNANLGIDLGEDGVTANDVDDTDIGPNNGQNTPVLTSIVGGGNTTTIGGTLNSLANSNFRIEFFSSDVGDPSGYGEGQVLLAYVDVATDGTGDASFYVALPIGLPAGHVVSATATLYVDHDSDTGTPDVARDTSEFAQNVVVPANRAPVAADDSPVVDEDNDLNGDLAPLSSDLDGDTLTFSQVIGSGPAHGSVVINTNGTYTYTPDDNFNGSDSFDYEVFDGDLTATGTINITVNPINDPATISGTAAGSTDEDSTTPVTGALSVDDVDAGEDQFAVQTGTVGSYGTLAIDAAGNWSYTLDNASVQHLNTGDQVTDTFTVASQDGTATQDVVITIDGIDDNQPPTAGDDSFTTDEDLAIVDTVTGGDFDPDGDTLTYSLISGPVSGTLDLETDGSFTYTPAAGFVGGVSFIYEVDDGNGETDQATVNITVNNLVDLSGVVFNDLDNNGIQDVGEVGIAGVRMQLWDDAMTTLIDEQTTAADGSYTFNSNLAAGTYRIVQAYDDGATTEIEDELSELGLLDGRETAGSIGGTVDNTQDSNTISGITVAAPGITSDAGGYNFAEIEPSSLQGIVFEDFDNDALVDMGELALEGIVIQLTGTDDRGNPVSLSQTTNSDGIFEFVDLRPGTYQIQENQPATLTIGSQTLTLIDGYDVVGSVNEVINGDNDGGNPALALVNDTFTGLNLATPGSHGSNYNFAERFDGGQQPDGGVTATIGFWQNKNGRELILGLNGDQSAGYSSTLLGDWLAATFPNMYGASANEHAVDLTGMTNLQVYDLYKSLFKRNKKSSPGGPPKLDAQVMAVALATYVTRSSLASQLHAGATITSQEAVDHVTSYGFTVSVGGLGSTTVNVGDNGAAFGVADNSDVSIMDLLLAVNDRSAGGLLFDSNGDGDIDSTELDYRRMANDLFSVINENGDI